MIMMIKIKTPRICTAPCLGNSFQRSDYNSLLDNLCLIYYKHDDINLIVQHDIHNFPNSRRQFYKSLIKNEVFKLGKAKSFFCGFLTGGIAAGMTVLLSTPKAGREVRYEIKNKWDETNIKLADVRATVESVKDSVSDFTRKGIPALQSTAREMKTIINTWKDDIQPNIQRISHRVEELKSVRSEASVSE
jgi:gas vesicle protein